MDRRQRRRRQEQRLPTSSSLSPILNRIIEDFLTEFQYVTHAYTKHVLHLYKSSSFVIRPLTSLLSTGLFINGQFRKMQPISVPFHGHRSISSTRSSIRRSTSITSMKPIVDLARKIRAQADTESPFSSANKMIEQTAKEALRKSKIKQESVSRERLLQSPINNQGEKPSPSEWRVDEADHSAIVKHMTWFMTATVRQMYSILRGSSPMLEAQLHFKPKTNYFYSDLYIKIADPRLGVPVLTAGAMASEIRNYPLISRSSDLDELLTGAAADGMIALSTSVNPIFLDALVFQARFNQMLPGSILNLHTSLAGSILTEKNLFSGLLGTADRPLQAQNNSIANSIFKELQIRLATSAATNASFSLSARFNQMLPGSILNLHTSLAGSILTEKNLFSGLLGTADRPNQLSNLLPSRTVPIPRSRDRLLPTVTNPDRIFITKGRFQFDNTFYSTLLPDDSWMKVVMSNLVQSMAKPASGTYAIGPKLLESVEVTSALIKRNSSDVGKQISKTLYFDDSSQVNVIPAFTQLIEPVHRLFDHAHYLLVKYGTTRSDDFKISTIDWAKKIFELSNLIIQKPLQVLRASNVSTRIANVNSPTLNFVSANSKSDYWNNIQRAENAYTYHIYVATSKSPLIGKLIEPSALHIMREFTIARPVSQATVVHRIKSQKQFQKLKSNIDSRLTDYNINSNPIQNEFVLSSDHPQQPTNFVNTIEGSNNHDKHLDEIGKEFQQASELRLLRTRIEQIFNRETSRHSDSQDNISLASQFSLKYNDILDETAVPYDKDGQRDEEMEIRSLTRKIEQIFDQELRRYRPITW